MAAKHPRAINRGFVAKGELSSSIGFAAKFRLSIRRRSGLSPASRNLAFVGNSGRSSPKSASPCREYQHQPYRPAINDINGTKGETPVVRLIARQYVGMRLVSFKARSSRRSMAK